MEPENPEIPAPLRDYPEPTGYDLIENRTLRLEWAPPLNLRLRVVHTGTYGRDYRLLRHTLACIGALIVFLLLLFQIPGSAPRLQNASRKTVAASAPAPILAAPTTPYRPALVSFQRSAPAAADPLYHPPSAALTSTPQGLSVPAYRIAPAVPIGFP